MRPIRILLADDHPLIREGFKAMLGKNGRFLLVGEAINGHELIALTAQSDPDIILMDISMPLLNGLKAMQEISHAHPLVKFVMLTMHEEREYILQALKGGASGYLLKSVGQFELERAIFTVFEGGKYFSQEVSNTLAEVAIKPDVTNIAELTSREREVLTMVSNGNSTKQIASKLNISIRTVESHRINMLKKMKVSNTAELIKKAVELKLLA